ncbi:hypothetical protein K2P47_05070 [Patescibacteria group bacterium]|nr:hypothetical protein [Patescibacteria group bacterium]
MAVPNRRSIDEEFRNSSYNQNGWGIQNAQASKMMTGGKPGKAANNRFQAQFQSDVSNQYLEPENPANDNRTLTSRPSEDGRRGRTAPRRYSGPYEQDDFADKVSRREQMIDQRYIADSQQLGEPANTNSAPQTKKVRTSLLARARGVSFGVVTMSWLVPIYLFWQVPMAMVGAIMLGLAMQIEANSFLSMVDGFMQSFGSLFGYEYFDAAGLGMLAVITAAVFGVVSACVACFTALLWGLHPLSGNAAGSKKATFLVGVVGACIPFINLFPWIIFWILVMMRHPK